MFNNIFTSLINWSCVQRLVYTTKHFYNLLKYFLFVSKYIKFNFIYVKRLYWFGGTQGEYETQVRVVRRPGRKQLTLNALIRSRLEEAQINALDVCGQSQWQRKTLPRSTIPSSTTSARWCTLCQRHFQRSGLKYQRRFLNYV